MFEFWKDLLQPIRADDDDFGKMRYLRQTSTWECVSHFEPINRPVEVFVFGEAGGPTKLQRQRWQALADHYPRLADEARTAIAPRLTGRDGEEFVFRLAAVTLPNDTEEEYEVELTFGDPSGPPQFDVRFSAWRVRDVIGPV